MIEVTISASSLDELSDKLTAMGNRLAVRTGGDTTPTEVPAEKAAAPAPKEKKAAAKPKAETPAEPAEESTGETPVYTDFDRDVAPIVTAAVERVGRDAVIGLLGEYAVGRASEIDITLWPEFVERLQDLA